METEATVVIIEGFQGRCRIWPGKPVLYWPNETSNQGRGSARSGSYSVEPLEARVVKITAKMVVILITQKWSPRQGKEMKVWQYRISSRPVGY